VIKHIKMVHLVAKGYRVFYEYLIILTLIRAVI